MAHRTFNVILCDSSPGIDGDLLLKEVQRDSRMQNTSVIFLSVKTDVWNRVKSLKLGAKDYIVKPVHVNEIIARVSMILNRSKNSREFSRSTRCP